MNMCFICVLFVSVCASHLSVGRCVAGLAAAVVAVVCTQARVLE